MNETNTNFDVKNLQIQSFLSIIVIFGSLLLASFMDNILIEISWTIKYVIYVLILVISIIIMVSGMLIEAYPLIKAIFQKDKSRKSKIDKKRTNIAWSIFFIGFILSFVNLIFFGILFSINVLQTL
ncbi:MAG: hypothetical protein K9W46_02030 [Candidatus Heimdallarchaeum endolithica]|uniref:DUF3899 domain-containing protein n=1 Tax=Candidatus Heimdallarchaeum endolithica TaxID=2876572 RepID=A0A9Y1BRT4_9ARCH|nr:MAG: hypothetical protein K9W46_02030 [Candidatus Heimdallarchaeum endolithica]